MSSECNLYRHFDADGTLLYVGISLSALSRLASHKNAAKWFDQIAVVRIERLESREAALAAERKAIKEERPRHNVVHNDPIQQIELIRDLPIQHRERRISIDDDDSFWGPLPLIGTISDCHPTEYGWSGVDWNGAVINVRGGPIPAKRRGLWPIPGNERFLGLVRLELR